MSVKVDPAVEFYNPAENDYDLAKDPRCLWGWGPPGKKGCYHSRFGHVCFRELGHRGKCITEQDVNGSPCGKDQRPKDWDTKGRAEANQ